MTSTAIAPAHRIAGNVSEFGKILAGSYVYIKNTDFSTSTVGSWVTVHSFTYTNGANATIELNNNFSVWQGTTSNKASQARARLYSSYVAIYFYSGAQYTQLSSNIDYRWHFNTHAMWENVPAGSYTYYLEVLCNYRSDTSIKSATNPDYTPCNFFLKEFR